MGEMQSINSEYGTPYLVTRDVARSLAHSLTFKLSILEEKYLTSIF